MSIRQHLSPSPLHINRFRVISKGNTGKWRLITDLSFPHGFSVNDGVDPEFCSLQYTTVEEIAEIIARLGLGALLAKFDIESAYRLIPVHPQDCPLQAMCWKERPTLIRCSRLASTQLPRFLMQWLMPSTGTYNRQGFLSSDTTLMTTSSLLRQTWPGARILWQSYTRNVAVWEYQLSPTNRKAPPHVLHFSALRLTQYLTNYGQILDNRFLLSFQRSRGQTTHQPNCLVSCWRSYWISVPIGHRLLRSFGSPLLSARPSPVYPENVSGSHETVSYVLSKV